MIDKHAKSRRKVPFLRKGATAEKLVKQCS